MLYVRSSYGSYSTYNDSLCPITNLSLPYSSSPTKPVAITFLLSRFYTLTTVNNARVNMGVQISL